jgi:ADP-ribose pyrophosphatase YjhB (NUDIX family)
MPYTCDNASVGVLIVNDNGELLMIRRAWFPVGIAPVAGHVFDEHTGYEEAAYAETEEEVGMLARGLVDTGVGGWRPNKCGAENKGSDPRAPGHEWKIFSAVASGTPRTTDEAKEVGWYEQPMVQALADRTARYALGEIAPADFNATPGLEPVWVGFLQEMGVVQMNRPRLEAIAYVYKHGEPRPSRAGNGPE